MSKIDLVKKAARRMVRILSGKKGIYGKIGKHNKFEHGVSVIEVATIGNNNYFGQYVMIKHAVIGNYCSIAPGVKMGQGEHSINFITTYQNISKRMINHSMETTAAVIGNDVWCGANAVVLQGVTIGDGAVIGANAVVTKDVPPYAIAVGAPAKVIRYRLPEEKIKRIQASGWFNHDMKEAMEIIVQLEKNE